MNVPDNKHKAPKDTLLNKILDEISSQRSGDSLDKKLSTENKDIIVENEPMPSEIEVESKQISVEDDKACKESSIELTDADVSTKKYCKKEIINEEDEEETAKKISWLKMFFAFLSIVFILNIVYIVYFMNTKKNYMEAKEEALISVEAEVIKEEIIEKEMPKPVIKTPTVIKREKIEITATQKPLVEIVQKETTSLENIPKTAEEIHQEKVKKDPQNFIDVIEMTTVTPAKVIAQESTRPLTAQEKKLRERHEAKALLLEQMNQ